MAATSANSIFFRSPANRHSFSISLSSWRGLGPTRLTSSASASSEISFCRSANGRARRDFRAVRPIRSSTDQPEKVSTVPILSSVLKKVLRLSTLPALMSSRTFCHENFFSSSASSFSVSVTAWAEAARSSPRKLQSRSQMTLPEPKKGRVCSASRSRASAVERLAAVGNGGLDDFVVHAAQFVAPLLVKLSGALLDGEFIVAANEGERWGFGGGHFIRPRCRFR